MSFAPLFFLEYAYLSYLKFAESISIPSQNGCLTIQFFIGKETEEIIGIEINPRFGGGFPLSYASGANYPEYIILEYILNDPITFNDNWIENRVMLRFDSEVILNKDDFAKK